MAQHIAPAELKNMIETQATFALIDVREQGEYNLTVFCARVYPATNCDCERSPGANPRCHCEERRDEAISCTA